MKLNWIAGMFFAAVLSVSAPAQVGVYVGSAPPPLRHEERSATPGPGYAWVDGYWAPNGHHYRWISGRWDRPPYDGAYWSHAHYDHYQQGWQMHEGHWDHENHDGRGHGEEHHEEHHDH